MSEKELCEMFIKIERQNSAEPAFESPRTKPTNKNATSQSDDLAQSLNYFIDAGSLADEEERYQEQVESFRLNAIPRCSSRPVPFETMQSPTDYSERTLIEQSDPDSIQKMSLAPEPLSVQHEELWLSMEQSFKNDDTPATIKKKEFTSCVDSPVEKSVLFTKSTPYKSNIFHGHDDTLEYSPIKYPEEDKTKNSELEWKLKLEYSLKEFSEEAKTEITPKASYQNAAWVVDMSEMPKTDTSVYFKKKDIFPMFIDLGENSTAVKEMPARLLSSLHSKKNCKSVIKTTSKTVKNNKKYPGPLVKDKKIETLCNTSQMGISEVLQRSVEKTDKEQREVKTRIAPIIREEPDTDQYCDTFVRLSDLDKALQKNDIVAIAPSTKCVERQTPTIPDNNWGETNHTSTRSIDRISSFHSENVIPHLETNISQSMPGSGRTESPLRLGVSSGYGERDELALDVFDMSSVQRSICHFVADNCQMQLQLDLLGMFMEEKYADVIVEVSGRKIKVHKCILTSRCQYFADILSGHWVKSVVYLPQFSYSVVYFALCHIYTGISNIPGYISIVELATLADMLNLEQLKAAIFTLVAYDYGHFHEPCQVPTAEVLERLPLSSVYLDELYRRCLRRIKRHFKVWPSKAFVTLTSERFRKCYQEHLLQLITYNFSNTVHDFSLAVESLERCRWAEMAPWLCGQLVGEAVYFASAHLPGLVYTATVPRTPPPNAAANALAACSASGVEWTVFDKLCHALALLHAVQERATPGQPPDFLAALRSRCQAAMRRWSRALSSSAFRNLPPDLLVALHRRCEAVLRRWPRAVSSSASRGLPPEVVPPTPPPNRYLPNWSPHQSAAPTAAHSLRSQLWVRTTKAQEQRAKFNMIKSTSTKPPTAVNRKLAPPTAVNRKLATPTAVNRKLALPPAVNRKLAPPPAVNRQPTKGRAAAAYRNANSRYQEPRPAAAGNDVGAAGKEMDAAASKPLSRLGSSSESPRNFSPVLAHVANTLRTQARRDIVAPSPQASRCNGTSSQTNETRASKIPVYSKLTVLRKGALASAAAPPAPRPSASARPSGSLSAQVGHPGSLMMATKSRSAKIVLKMVKDTSQANHSMAGRRPPLERSDTFLKEEPTFGDRTTEIDE